MHISMEIIYKYVFQMPLHSLPFYRIAAALRNCDIVLFVFYNNSVIYCMLFIIDLHSD